MTSATTIKRPLIAGKEPLTISWAIALRNKKNAEKKETLDQGTKTIKASYSPAPGEQLLAEVRWDLNRNKEGENIAIGKGEHQIFLSQPQSNEIKDKAGNIKNGEDITKQNEPGQVVQPATDTKLLANMQSPLNAQPPAKVQLSVDEPLAKAQPSTDVQPLADAQPFVDVQPPASAQQPTNVQSPMNVQSPLSEQPPLSVQPSTPTKEVAGKDGDNNDKKETNDVDGDENEKLETDHQDVPTLNKQDVKDNDHKSKDTVQDDVEDKPQEADDRDAPSSVKPDPISRANDHQDDNSNENHKLEKTPPGTNQIKFPATNESIANFGSDDEGTDIEEGDNDEADKQAEDEQGVLNRPETNENFDNTHSDDESDVDEVDDSENDASDDDEDDDGDEDEEYYDTDAQEEHELDFEVDSEEEVEEQYEDVEDDYEAENSDSEDEIQDEVHHGAHAGNGEDDVEPDNDTHINDGVDNDEDGGVNDDDEEDGEQRDDHKDQPTIPDIDTGGVRKDNSDTEDKDSHDNDEDQENKTRKPSEDPEKAKEHNNDSAIVTNGNDSSAKQKEVKLPDEPIPPPTPSSPSSVHSDVDFRLVDRDIHWSIFVRIQNVDTTVTKGIYKITPDFEASEAFRDAEICWNFTLKTSSGAEVLAEGERSLYDMFNSGSQSSPQTVIPPVAQPAVQNSSKPANSQSPPQASQSSPTVQHPTASKQQHTLLSQAASALFSAMTPATPPQKEISNAANIVASHATSKSAHRRNTLTTSSKSRSAQQVRTAVA